MFWGKSTGVVQGLAVAALLGGVSCNLPQPQSTDTDRHHATQREPIPSAPPPSAVESTVDLRIEIEPRPAATPPVMAVTLTIEQPALQKAAWLVPPQWLQPVTMTVAWPASPQAQSVTVTAIAADRISLPHLDGPTGPVQLRYVIPAQWVTSPSTVQQHFVAQGHHLLPLPDVQQSPMKTRVSVHTQGYGKGREIRSASSFGLSPGRVLPITRDGLARSVFAGGVGGQALLDGPEGYDEALWLGYTAFDPRPLAAEVASFRTAVRNSFNDGEVRPQLLVLGTDHSLQSGFELARATAGVVARIAPWQPLTGAFRVALYQRQMNEWIGPLLSLRTPDDRLDVAFHEGMARHLATAFAFEFHLLSPEEYLEEINGLIALQQLTGPSLRGDDCAQLPPLADTASQHQCAALYRMAQGAIYATSINAVLRQRGTSLAQLLAELMANETQPMTLKVWQAALDNASGGVLAPSHGAFVEGRPMLLNRRALGPCFRSARLRFDHSEKGFSYDGRPGQWTIVDVDLNGPAYAAGLRKGMTASRITHAPHAPSQPIVVEFEQAEAMVFEGIRARHSSRGFARNRSVPDSQCRAQ